MISILIPAYNEESILEASILKVHNYCLEQSFDHEIIVTSNGSTDGTEAVGRALQEKNSYLRFFSISNKSVGEAFKVGVTNARYENIICLDADLSSDLAFIDYALKLLEYSDMVVGSKTMGSQRRGFIRIIGSQVYIVFTLLFFDLTISDYSIGAKAFKRTAILPALDNLEPWTGYVFELCLFLKYSGKKIIQVGIDCNDFRKSHFNLLHEGIHRYKHLWHCWHLTRSKNSWLYRKS